MKKGVAGSLFSLITVLNPAAIFASSTDACVALPGGYVAKLKAESEEQVDLNSYLKDAKISEAQNEAFKITDFTQLHISGFSGNSEKEDRIGASQPDIFEIRHLSQSFVNKQ